MHYLVIFSLSNSKRIPVLFVGEHARFKPDGTAANEFVKLRHFLFPVCLASHTIEEI